MVSHAILAAPAAPADVPAPAELIERTRRFLWRTANREARRVGLEPADVFQELAVGILTSRGYDPARGSPVTWAMVVSRGVLQRLRRTRPRELLASDESLNMTPAKLSNARYSGPGADLVWALNQLPKKERVLVVRRFGLDGRGERVKDLAEEEGVSPQTCSARLGRAIERLRRILITGGLRPRAGEGRGGEQPRRATGGRGRRSGLNPGRGCKPGCKRDRLDVVSPCRSNPFASSESPF